MCTLIVRQGMDDGCSMVVAANRDEFYHRPASGPQVLVKRPRAVGGRDERAGGTWLGLSSNGLFVGLTNQRNFGAPNQEARSRGQLVVDVLRSGSFDRAIEHLQSIDPRSYNEFNILCGDGARLVAAYGRNDARHVELEWLGVGVHVLSNDRLGSPDYPKAHEAKRAVESISSLRWDDLQAALTSILSDRSLPAPESVPPLPEGALFDAEAARRLHAICVDTPTYGTVSATLAAISPGRVDRYLFCDGPPDSAPFVDFTDLVRNVR